MKKKLIYFNSFLYINILIKIILKNQKKINMTKIIKKLFDIVNFSFKNICLIEASAGTGKTFTISLLYLKILIGINTKQHPVDKILVVTFTKLAKEELYSRIKNNINNLKIACQNKVIHQNSILKKIFDKIKNFKQAYISLKIAEYNFHNSEIHTIDSFFQQILNWNTFESNIELTKKIINNEEEIYSESAIIYWRKYYYSLPLNITCIIYNNWNNPEHLLLKIKPYIKNQEFIKNIPINYKINTIYQKCIIFNKLLKTTKIQWLSEKKKISEIIKKYNINKRIYHTKNISKWIKKISLWAILVNNIKKYNLPNELKYFQQNQLIKQTKNKKFKKYKIFQNIELLFKKLKKINILLFNHAILNIKKIISLIKKKKKKITFDDVLNKLNIYIKKYQLHKIILKKYPIAFIDEFQDTNKQQFNIFKKIYIKKNGILILIGDPKQLIYSFRGASISNYFKIKSIIHSHYFLNINWRASIRMNQAINILFNQLKYPFIIKDIYFLPTYSPDQNNNMSFIVNKNIYPACKIIYNNKKKSIQEYQEWISKKCAQNIFFWINSSKNNNAIIKINNKIKKIHTSDIVILVRNKIESEIIKNQLDHLNIPNIYLSEKKNIFQSQESHEILYILQASENIYNINYLKKACFTKILQKTSNEILYLSKNHKYLSLVIEEFQSYYKIWKKFGIFNLIQYILLKYIKFSKNIKQITIDKIICIGEILQKKSEHYHTFKELIIWFKKKISTLKIICPKKITHTSNSNNYIKIISIHKSKGLEYPIVWIPFGIQKINYIQKNKYIKSEEIRLLYVACTRASIHCSIGISTIQNKNNIQEDNTNLYDSAFGYIIQKGKQITCKKFNDALKKINYKNIIEIHANVDIDKQIKTNHHNHIIEEYDFIKTKYKKKPINLYYGENTSFSKIQNFFKKQKKSKNIIHNINKNISIHNNKNPNTIHTFQQGKESGIFLHKILNKINFQNKINIKWLSKQLKNAQISEKWIKILYNWFQNILITPLNKDLLTLSKIYPNKCIKELKFLIPIKKYITYQNLHKIRNSYDSKITITNKIKFHNIQGMLHGSIDLVFLWKNKYYLLDYKSNWLGKNNTYYNIKNIKKEILNKNYDLQYQFYALALHRYLKIKIKKYSFSKHFGGIFYIFLRAIEKESKNLGIFFTIPKKKFIDKLNNLFG